jgi:hypothetical protein
MTMKTLTSTLSIALLLGSGLAQAATPNHVECIELNEYVLGSIEGNGEGFPYVGPEVVKGSSKLVVNELVFASDGDGDSFPYVGPEVSAGSGKLVLNELVFAGDGDGGDWGGRDLPAIEELPATAAGMVKTTCQAG